MSWICSPGRQLDEVVVAFRRRLNVCESFPHLYSISGAHLCNTVEWLSEKTVDDPISKRLTIKVYELEFLDSKKYGSLE